MRPSRAIYPVGFLVLAKLAAPIQINLNVNSFVVTTTESSIQALMTSIPPEKEGLAALLQLIANKETLLHHIYAQTCKLWKAADLDKILDWVHGLAPRDRDMILSVQCLANVGTTLNVYDKLIARKIPFQALKRYGMFTKQNWSDVFSYMPPEYLYKWCYGIPSKLLTYRETSAINLVKYMNHECLANDYYSKRILGSSLHRQLLRAAPCDMSRLLLNMKNVSPRSMQGLRRQLKLAVCKTNHNSVFARLNAKVYSCTNHNAYGISNELQIALSGSDFDNDQRILLVRLGLYVFGIYAWLDFLRESSNLVAIEPTQALIHLALDVARENVHIRRQLFRNFGISYDEYILSIPKNRLSREKTEFIGYPITFHLEHHKRWNFYPGRYKETNNATSSVIPLVHILQPNVDYAYVKDAILEHVSNHGNFVTHKYLSPDRIPVIRPRLWLLSSHFEKVLNLMLYSLVRFQKPAAVLDSRICSLFRRPKGEWAEFKEDFTYQGKLEVEDQAFQQLRLNFRNGPKTLDNFFRTHLWSVRRLDSTLYLIYRQWGLENVIISSEVCHFLTRSNLDYPFL